MKAGEMKLIVENATLDRINKFLPWLNQYMAAYQINTIARSACFLANLAHESGSFRYVREIASGKAYEGRKDLGNTQKGDGVKFRGRGLIQVTGRANYLACSLALFNDSRLIATPELLEQPQYAVESACWFWKTRSLNQLSDRVDPALPLLGDNLKAFKAVVRRINGGTNGLEERIEFFQRAVFVMTPPIDIME